MPIQDPLKEVENRKLKIAFFVHYFLTYLACIPKDIHFNYLVYNSVFVGCIWWSIFAENDDCLQFAVVVNVLSLCLDLIYFIYIIFYLDLFGKFACLLLMLHMIVKPFTTIFLYRELKKRQDS